MPAGLATLAIGILLGLGVLLAWLRTRPEAGTAGPKRLAVLPFENLGRPEDGYFADGVTDEVRGKLAALPGLEVIARTSSVQYKETTKSPRQIGQELGVEYLLTGTVRWEKDAGGPSRVRVSPELVQVSTASTKWQAALRCPAHRRVPGAGRRGRPAWPRRLAWRSARASASGSASGPTENLAAYDAFLRGEQAADGLATIDLAALRRARDYYERAVALDSSFALAWAQLSRAHSSALLERPEPRGSGGRSPGGRAGAGARAQAPRGLPGPRRTTTRSCATTLRAPSSSTRRARQLAPKDARLLAWAGWGEFLLGRFEEGLAHMREAEVLDPRSVDIASSLTWPLLTRRRYAEALATAERARALAPSNLAGDRHRGGRPPRPGRPGRGAGGAPGRATGGGPRGAGGPHRHGRPLLGAGRRAAAAAPAALARAVRRRPRRVGSGAGRDPRAPGGFRRRREPTPTRLASRTRPGSATCPRTRRPTRTWAWRSRTWAGAPRRSVRANGAWSSCRSAGTRCWGQISSVCSPGPTPSWVSPRRRSTGWSRCSRYPTTLSPGWLRIDPTFAPLRGNPRFERLVAGK